MRPTCYLISYIFETTLYLCNNNAKERRYRVRRDAHWPSVWFDVYDAGAQAHSPCSQDPSSQAAFKFGDNAGTQGHWFCKRPDTQALAEGVCSNASTIASLSVSGLRGADMERGMPRRWGTLAKGLPLTMSVALSLKRVLLIDMVQARSLGSVGDGRSQAEGCVSFPATSALSFPWLFRGGCFQTSRGNSPHRISNAGAGPVGLHRLRSSHLSGLDDRATPDSQLSGHFHYFLPLPALALASVVRRIATATCGGRQCRTRAAGLRMETRVLGFPILLASPLEATPHYFYRPRSSNQLDHRAAYGCLAWNCLRVLSLGLPTGAYLVVGPWSA
ncbi:hypothetical protein H4582DRAFT_2188327 [Lactarius indigo]|nr:hypothetical protein H4582DRAFT_2188327 [Lactarius indigo]